MICLLRRSAVAAGSALLLLSAATSAPASAATGPSNGTTFTVASVNSGKNLDVAGGSSADGAGVVQNAASGAASQSWTTTSAANGGYTLVDKASGKCLTVSGGSTAAQAAIVQQTCAGATEQNWTITTTSAGVSTLTSARSGLCLDVTARSTADGAAVIQYRCTGGTNQQWRLESVAAGTRVSAWAPGLNPGGRSFANQTIREVVHPTVGGTAPRLRLTNRFGNGPLTAGHVDLAVRASGGTVMAGSHHRVTFSGAGSVTVAAGAEVLSDPIAMTVTADQDLLASIYVSNSLGASTWQRDALSTTYLSGSGDHAADDGTAGYPSTDGSWYLLDGLDLVSTTATGTLVAFGDSITAGARSTANTNRRYPDQLARRLTGTPGGPRLAVVDAGIGSNQVLRDLGSNGGYSALNRFDHDALGQPNVRDVILLEGINDIRDSSAPTAQQIINGYRTLIAKAHAAGVAVYGATILPAGGATGYTTAHENVRSAVNSWIRTSGAYDGVIDLDAALRDPASPTRMLAAYDSGDHLHPGDAGYQAMANAVNLGMLRS